MNAAQGMGEGSLNPNVLATSPVNPTLSPEDGKKKHI